MNNLLFKVLILGLLVLAIGMVPVFAFAESNNVSFETITIQSIPLEISDISTGQESSHNNGVRSLCILPVSTSVQVPDTVQIGDIFDVIVTPSFELTQQQLDDYNKSSRTEFDNTRELWDAVCHDYWRYYTLTYPATYEPSGDNVSYYGHNINDQYFPPYEIHVSKVQGLSFDGNSTTFQMTINEPITYLTSDLEDDENLDYLKHDYGAFVIQPTTTAVTLDTLNPIPIYTSIDNGLVTLSEFESGRSQTEPNLEDLNSNIPLEPFYSPHNNYVLPHNLASTTTDDDGPKSASMEWIADLLETYPDNYYTAETLIEELGLPDTFLEKFLEAYPQYNTRTQSSNSDTDLNLPLSDEQSSSTDPSIQGMVSFRNSDDIRVPINSVTVCVFDASIGGVIDRLFNNQIPSCDISDSNGVFAIPMPLTDSQISSNSRDIILRAYFENEDFEIVHYKLNPLGGVESRATSIVHSVDAHTPRYGIPLSTYNYGNFELPPMDASTRASYILNTLQPTHDWYNSTVLYDPPKAKINWTPGLCESVRVDVHTNNLMSLAGFSNNLGIPCGFTSSPIKNPHVLRHEYAHQTQNVFYLSADGRLVNNDCNLDPDSTVSHSPMHVSGPMCAWNEGWVYFMAIAYDGIPIYYSSAFNSPLGFETRVNTETQHMEIAGREFVNGNQEGNIAAGLYDIIDNSSDEFGDALNEPISRVWSAINDGGIAVRNVTQFKEVWESQNPQLLLDDIFALNTLHTLDGVSHPPSNLNAAVNDNHVDLYWDASNDDSITGYKILSVPPYTSNPTVIPVPDSFPRNVLIPNLISNTTYNFNIVAVNRHGDSEPSDSIIVLTAHVSIPPFKPTNLIATPTHNSMTLNWDDSFDASIDGYKILSRTSNERALSVLITDTGNSDSTYVAENLLPDTIYIFKVIAINEFGESPASAFVRLSTLSDSLLPTKPTNLIATSTHNSMTLDWDDPSDDSITGYKILSRISGPTQLSILIPDTGNSETRYVVENLTPDTTYVFKVVAINEFGESTLSKFVRQSTLSAPIITTPIITVPDDITVEANNIVTYVDIGTATIPDNFEFDISNDISSEHPAYFPLGTTVVTWTATNSMGDTVEATQTITLVDTVAPTLYPSHILRGYFFYENQPRIVTFNSPSSYDLVDRDVDVICDPASGELFVVGDTLVTCTGTDDSGNSSILTFIIFVNTSPSNPPPATYSYGFDSSLGSWTYSERPNTRLNNAHCDNMNEGGYAVSHSTEHGGSAHISPAIECWSGIAGAIRNFDLPRNHNNLEISFDYRTIIQPIFSYSNDILVLVTDSSDTIIHVYDAYSVDRGERLSDSGWRNFEDSGLINLSNCPCHVFVFLEDIAYHYAPGTRHFYIDNVSLNTSNTSRQLDGLPVNVSPNALKGNDYLNMRVSNSTVINEVNLFSNAIKYSWDGTPDTDYKVMISSENSEEIFTDFTTDNDYAFVDIEPDTLYTIAVGPRDDDTKQSQLSFTTLTADQISYNSTAP